MSLYLKTVQEILAMISNYVLYKIHHVLCDTISFFRPENPSPVVVYGNSKPECASHAEWLAGKLDKLKTDRKIVATVKPQDTDSTDEPVVSTEKKFDPFEHFCLTIADHAKEVWLLEGGYDSFRTEYDFLCGRIEFDEMFPLPHQINRFLFLGSRVFPLTRECLSKLRITHMIVSEYQTLDWSQLDGISVLRCSVQDNNSQNMIPCWEACMRFITEAVSGEVVQYESQVITSLNVGTSPETSTSSDRTVIGNSPKALPSTIDPQTQELCSSYSLKLVESLLHDTSISERASDNETGLTSSTCNRVLVILFGRSRSTSVILAHLIRMQGMSFDDAWSLVRTRCWHLIDKSLVYEEQLRTAWQRVD